MQGTRQGDWRSGLEGHAADRPVGTDGAVGLTILPFARAKPRNSVPIGCQMGNGAAQRVVFSYNGAMEPMRPHGMRLGGCGIRRITMANKLGIFLAGGVIGAAVALLYAPRPGVETRAMVAERANEAWGQAQDLGGQVAVRGQEAYATAVAQGQRAYGQAQEFGQTVYTNVTAASQAAGARAAAMGKQAYESASAGAKQAYEAAAAGAKQAYAGAKTGAAAAAQRMQETADTVRPIFAEKNDELRAKIDAARERIAAQVTKNAEAAHAAVAEKAPIAAEGAAADVAEPEQIAEAAAPVEPAEQPVEEKKDAE